MSHIKAILKNFFYKTGHVQLLDKLLFRMHYLKNRTRNKRFRQANKQIAMPSDYFLYETYRLDYQEYINDGKTSAREIVEWTNKYVNGLPGQVMEWGCGVSRIIRHLPALYSPATKVYGCDINKEMIAWNEQHIQDVQFATIDYNPPTGYGANQFDMIFAISVFTHINGKEHLPWFKEIHRVLQKQGVFLFTTHGRHYVHQLLDPEKRELEKTGMFTKSYNRKGHRMMTSYNSSEQLAALIEPYFQVLEFFEGETHKTKAGGQDLWIVRKK